MTSAPTPQTTPATSSAKSRPTNEAYYDFHSTPWHKDVTDAQTWMLASEVRAQLETLPASGRYPSVFHNIEGLIDHHGQILHHPLIPGQQTAYANDGEPGGIRVFYYQEGGKQEHLVGYHIDEKKFALAKFVEAAP
ncbi:hypothetical protein BU26DRAFT_512151 [Trematosphaeria pertusa]|uniref:Uncharacterized protein n=1 Tax=Trematosphaeria pertusa TaxID=390896 RepID=A0A6A6HRU7_9PLEO|nr:uncharacterized protein BU26DRAFT_512151 [Trematosphaeria pertusa]KAF2240707.1 hypothetical protein BU26DRAFT_512151 [Trematosphaeria pertusa]